MGITVLRRNELPHLLLVEPDTLIRSTVSGVCKQLSLAQVHQASSVAVAQQMLEGQPMEMMLVSLNEGEEAFGLLDRLRAGAWETSSSIPIAVTSGHAHEVMVDRIRGFQVRRLLLQPFKIRDVVNTVETLREALEERA